MYLIKFIVGVYFTEICAISAAPIFRDLSKAWDEVGPKNKIIESNVECHRTSLILNLKMTEPFYGYIYPVNRFEDCVLFAGNGERSIKLKLGKQICGKKDGGQKSSHIIDPVIEHELMIQWEPDLVEESDTRMVIRCDAADLFKTLNVNVEIK